MTNRCIQLFYKDLDLFYKDLDNRNAKQKTIQGKAIQGNSRQFKAIQGKARHHKAIQQWGVDILPVIMYNFKVSHQFLYRL